MRIRRFRTGTGLLACMLAVVLQSPMAAAFGAELPRPIRGDYSAAISLPGSGGINVGGTLDRLSRAHVGTYAYEICGGTADWQALPAFLDAAEARGIEVWAYLCPPSETADDKGGPDFPPFGWDYPRWAAELARLSLSHPALTAFAIDDFAENTGVFTPEYAAQTAVAARAVNPRFRFYPVLYYRDLVGPDAVVGPYLQAIDGVIFPFRDEPAYDTLVSDTAAAQILHARQAIGDRALLVMIYGERFGHQTNPDAPAPQYVEAVARDALALAEYGVDDGVVIYKMNLTGHDTPYARADVYDRVKVSFAAVPGQDQPQRLNTRLRSTTQAGSPRTSGSAVGSDRYATRSAGAPSTRPAGAPSTRPGSPSQERAVQEAAPNAASADRPAAKAGIPSNPPTYRSGCTLEGAARASSKCAPDAFASSTAAATRSSSPISRP